jgi:Carboxypeptidase activation peptide
MKHIVKFLLFPILALHSAKCDSHEADIIDAIPVEIYTEPAVVSDKDRAGIEPIKYDGAQLWRISYADQLFKNAITELQKDYQVAMWNLQMVNLTSPYVDIFVKKSMVDEARNFLQKSNVPYEIVIDDVQQVIDKQNPPIDDMELWQNRNGK